MGYCIEMVESTVSIKKENAQKIMGALSDYIKEKHPNWMWVYSNRVQEYCENLEFENVMEEIRYAIREENNEYVIWYFAGEKLGDDEEIFEIISPFINDGYIEMLGEDGCEWRWWFKDGNLITENLKSCYGR